MNSFFGKKHESELNKLQMKNWNEFQVWNPTGAW